MSTVIGQAVTRIDGKLKVTGGAPYAVEHPIDNVGLRRGRGEHDWQRKDQSH